MMHYQCSELYLSFNYFYIYQTTTKQIYSIPNKHICRCTESISTKEEILSRPLADVTHLDSQCIKVAASVHTEFDIKLPSVKRKSSMDASTTAAAAAVTNCHFVAVTCVGRKPTHFLITFGITSNNNNNIMTTAVTTVNEYSSNNFETLNQMQSSGTFSAINIAQQQSQPPLIPKQNTEPRGSLHGSIRRGMV